MVLSPAPPDWACVNTPGAASSEAAEVLQVDRQLRLIREQYGVCARDLVTVRQELLALRGQQEDTLEQVVRKVEALDASRGRHHEDFASRLEAEHEVLRDRVEYLEQAREERFGPALGDALTGLGIPELRGRVDALERALASSGEERAEAARLLGEVRLKGDRLEARQDELGAREGDATRAAESLERAVGALAERQASSRRAIADCERHAAGVEERLDAFECELRAALAELEDAWRAAASRHAEEARALSAAQARHAEDSKSAHANLANVTLTLDSYCSSLREQVAQLQEVTSRQLESLRAEHADEARATARHVEVLRANHAKDTEELRGTATRVAEGLQTQLQALQAQARQLSEEQRRSLAELRSRTADDVKSATEAQEARVAAVHEAVELLRASVRQSAEEHARRVEASLAERDAKLAPRLEHLERCSWEEGKRRLQEELATTAASEAHAAASLSEMRGIVDEAAAMDAGRAAVQERVDRVESVLGIPPFPPTARAADAGASRALGQALERLIAELTAVRGGHKGLVGQAAAQSQRLDDLLAELRRERTAREASDGRLRRVELSLAEGVGNIGKT